MTRRAEAGLDGDKNGEDHKHIITHSYANDNNIHKIFTIPSIEVEDAQHPICQFHNETISLSRTHTHPQIEY